MAGPSATIAGLYAPCILGLTPSIDTAKIDTRIRARQAVLRIESDDDNNVHAGHMFQSVVHVVGEIHIRIMSKAIMTRCPLPDVELLGLQFS